MRERKGQPQRLVHLVRVELIQRLTSWRWTVCAFLFILVAYLQGGRVLVNAANQNEYVNIWDALFSIFANRHILMFVLIPLYLYGISDLVVDRGWGETYALRCGSRKWWWYGKAVALAVITATYVALGIALAGGTSTFAFRAEGNWSTYARQTLADLYLSPMLLALPPGLSLLILGVWLFLSLYGFGMITIALSLQLNAPVYGFTGGMALLFFGFLLIDLPIFSWVHMVSPTYHLLILSAMDRYSVLALSFGYWLVWIVLIGFWGLRLSQTHHFLTKGRT